MARKKRRARKAGSKARRAAPAVSRPAFAQKYPADPDLDRLLAAFVAGNFAYVRREAPKLAERSDDQELLNAARDLRRRLDPSPTAMYLWGLGVALLAFLFTFYLSH